MKSDNKEIDWPRYSINSQSIYALKINGIKSLKDKYELFFEDVKGNSHPSIFVSKECRCGSPFKTHPEIGGYFARYEDWSKHPARVPNKDNFEYFSGENFDKFSCQVLTSSEFLKEPEV